MAVLLVLLDHLRTRMAGGYIGVDVFFVISGYLISGIIVREMKEGRFSLVRFYERRVRRIVPALLVMLAVTTFWAFRYMTPEALASYGRTLAAALLSFSNMVFWKQAGYFDAPSLAKPLLHTWSLAVEEQFYIVFPLLLMALHRWAPSRLRETIYALWALTFALACFWVRKDASAAFFWAPLRAWELLTGAIVSQRYLPAIRSAASRQTAAGLGFLLILVPGVLYTATTPFPGAAALPPCLGAALIIAAGEHGTSWVGRLLAWRPVVFVGLISYSLYLWHWPLVVFQNSNGLLLNRPGGNDHLTKLVLGVASIVVGALSWRLVETPFREGKWRPTRRTVFAIGAAGTAAMLAVAVTIMRAQGMPSRFTPEEAEIAAVAAHVPTDEVRQGTCFVTQFADFQPARCLAVTPGRKHFLLIGDSVSAQLYPGLEQVFPQIDWWQANASNCLPFQDVRFLENLGPNAPNCVAMSRFLYGDLLERTHPDAVLISAHWREEDMDELGRTIDWLKARGLRVVLFGETMEYDEPLGSLLFTAVHTHNMRMVDAHWMEGGRTLDRRMHLLAATRWHVPLISEFDDLCATQVEMEARAQTQTSTGCPVFAAPGVPLIFDRFHLTVPGAVLYARRMRDRHQLP